MSIRNVALVEGEFFHVYNRGNSKQIIFKDKEDYYRFLELLYVANCDEHFNLFDLKRDNNFDVFLLKKNNSLVAIGAYCLMPNHFHLLLTPMTENGISKFMQKVTTAYSMYFNKKYKRTGSLFEGKFKSEHASEDRYLKYLFSYIHLNPVKLIHKNWKEDGLKNKVKVFEYLSQYQYSSFLDYLETNRKQQKILNKEHFPNYFISKNVFKNEIYDWLHLR